MRLPLSPDQVRSHVQQRSTSYPASPSSSPSSEEDAPPSRVRSTATNVRSRSLRHGMSNPKAIEAGHGKSDVNRRRGAWTQLLGIRKRADEGHTEFYRRGDDARTKLEHASNLTPQQRSDELLRATLHGLPPDDPLRHQLAPHSNLTLKDIYSAFERIDQASNSALKTCRRCDQPDHTAKNCPHLEAIRQVVNQRTGHGNKGGKPKGKSKGNGTSSSSSNPSSSSHPSSTQRSMEWSLTLDHRRLRKFF